MALKGVILNLVLFLTAGMRLEWTSLGERTCVVQYFIDIVLTNLDLSEVLDLKKI